MTETKYPAITRDYDTLSGLILATNIGDLSKQSLQKCLDRLYETAYEGLAALNKVLEEAKPE